MNYPTTINLTMKDGTEIKLVEYVKGEDYVWRVFGKFIVGFLLNDLDEDWEILLSVVGEQYNTLEAITWFEVQHKAEKYIPEILEQLSKRKV